MKHTKEEIINALKVIKDECKEASDCAYCPFGEGDNSCMLIFSNPEEWEIAELPPPQTWRALK